VKEIEATGKTVHEAVQTALGQLGVDKDKVEVVVIKKGRPGVFGMGSEGAKVVVKLIEQSQERIDIGNKAKEVLEKILEHLDLAAKVEILRTADTEMPLTLNIEGDDLGALIGRRGQALADLQYIVRLIVSENFKKWVPINIDIAGYKKRRYESLRNLAFRLADQVKKSRRSINLEPMPSDERRIIHLTLADHPDVATQSIGEGEKRKVVIQLKKR
jgi:spoIIIJ-associated protein